MIHNSDPQRISEEPKIYLGKDLKIVRAQAMWFKKQEFSKGLKRGQSFAEALPSIWDEHLAKLCKECLSGGITHCIETTVVRASSIVWLEILIEPWIKKSRIAGLVLTFKDITLEKRIERHHALREKMLAISLIAAEVAHQFNNPLSAILNRIGSILIQDFNKLDLDYTRNELLIIQEQVYTMSVLTNSLVAFSKESAATYRFVKINEVVKKAVELAKLLQGKNTINYRLDLDENLPPILGSEITLEQCLINIIRNSLEAMPQGGTLTIITTRDHLSDRFINIRLSDTGPGIPESDLEHVFEPFFKTKDDRHSGLGLSISYGIVANHDGSIEINSLVGKGTEVSVLLPIAQQ